MLTQCFLNFGQGGTFENQRLFFKEGDMNINGTTSWLAIAVMTFLANVRWVLFGPDCPFCDCYGNCCHGDNFLCSSKTDLPNKHFGTMLPRVVILIIYL